MITFLWHHVATIYLALALVIGLAVNKWRATPRVRKDVIRRRLGLARRGTWRMDYWLPRRLKALKWLRKFVLPDLLCPRCYGPTVRVHECMWRECEICEHHITEEKIYGSMGTFRGTLWLIMLGTRRRRTAKPLAALWGSGGVINFMTDGKTIIGLGHAMGYCAPDYPENRRHVEYMYGGAFYELNYVPASDLAAMYSLADRAGVSLERTPTREGALAEYRRMEGLIEKYTWGAN